MTTNPIRSVFQCTLTLLTPVHVGTGEKLQEGFDFIRNGNNLHVIDSARMFAEVEKRGPAAINAFTKAIENRGVGEWLQTNGVALKDISSYSITLPVKARSPRTILPHIRDGMATPIIPGSSLKGALRTAIIRKLAVNSKSRLLKQTIDRLANPKTPKPKHADEQLLKKILGESPNESLMRLLTVGDFSFSSNGFTLQAVELFRLESPKGTRLAPKKMPPIWIERLPENAASNGTVSFDDYLAVAGGNNGKYLGAQSCIDLPWLVAACRELADHTMQTEVDFLKDKKNTPADELHAFYDKILPSEIARLSDNEAIIQMAWGSGWRGITGQLLTPDDLTPTLRNKLDLAAKPKYLDFPFPKSRRAATNGQQILPMGWVKLSFKSMEEVREEEREKQRLRCQELVERQKEEAEAAEFLAEWKEMDQLARDLACVNQQPIALKCDPADANDPNVNIWKRLEQAPSEHKQQLALAFKERWQREDRWKVKNKKGKQFKKISMVKDILGE